MKSLREVLADYLLMRRNLGYKLKLPGVGLASFVDFMEEQGALTITTELALRWAQQPAQMELNGWATRLGYVRGFARYLSAIDPRTEIPPSDLLPYRSNRAKPYLYTQEEIQKLLSAARTFPRSDGLGRWNYYCVFGLLAVSGMRLGEVLNLKVDDVDLQNGVLTITGSKFGKSRLIPLHDSTVDVLRDYKLRREQLMTPSASAYLFVSRTGNRLRDQHVERMFLRLSRMVGLRSPGARSCPRLHDFRHRFAVETLLRWYRSGQDAEQRLPILSTYLGHVSVSSTYWYLTACPELMGEAVKLLELRWGVTQ